MRRTGLFIVALAVLGTLAETVAATPPGTNGSITFRRYLGPDRTIGAIFTVAPDGTGERQLSQPPEGASDDFPDFAADGSFVAFQRCQDFCKLFTVRADGSGVRQVGPGCEDGQAPPRCADVWYPAVSPDTKRIAFAHASGRIVDDIIAHVGISVMRTDGSGLRRVTLPPKRAAEDGEPQWSPDGRKLVFVRYILKSGKQAIHTVNADGSGLRRVTPWALKAGDGPDWSPDGSRILFRSPENDDFLGSNLYTIRPDGSGLRRIMNVPEGTRLYSASCSPDGTAITLGLQGTDGAADVFRMPADGSAITPVTRTAAWDSAPDRGGTASGRGR